MSGTICVLPFPILKTTLLQGYQYSHFKDVKSDIIKMICQDIIITER
jgi:hypothetical protein